MKDAIRVFVSHCIRPSHCNKYTHTRMHSFKIQSVSQPEKCLSYFWSVLKCVCIMLCTCLQLFFSPLLSVKARLWTKLNGLVITVRHTVISHCLTLTCVCVCLPGLVHRPESNPEQTREEEAVGGRHSDRHQSDWVRPACSACQDQQQVDIWSLTDSPFPSLANTQKNEHLIPESTHKHTHSLTLPHPHQR